MTDRSRVYVTQEQSNLNYVPAEQFGEVVFLTRKELSPMKNSLQNKALMSELRHKLKDFDPKCDFLAPSGSPIVTGLAFAIVAAKHKVFCALRWSNRDAAYHLIEINLTH